MVKKPSHATVSLRRVIGEKRVNTDSIVGFCINYGCAPEGLKNRQPHKSRKQSLNTGLGPQSTYIYRVQSSVWRLQNY
jgi:hypothetical protein